MSWLALPGVRIKTFSAHVRGFGSLCAENVLVRTRKLRNGRRDAEIRGDNMYLCRRNIEM